LNRQAKEILNPGVRESNGIAVPRHTIMVHRGSNGTAALILNLGTILSALCVSRVICQQLPVPTQQEAGWTLQLVWMFWRRDKCVATAAVGTAGHAACSLVTTLTQLHKCVATAAVGTAGHAACSLVTTLTELHKCVATAAVGTAGHAACSLVTTLTELYQLLKPRAQSATLCSKKMCLNC